MIVCRRAVLDDVPALASVHVASWRETYTGLLPQRVIAARTVDIRMQQWDRVLRSQTSATIVAEKNGTICGFATVVATPNETFDAYLQALYVVAATHRMGAGRELVSHVARVVSEWKLRSLVLHVVASNPARGIYERMGARYVSETVIEDGDDAWKQATYAWDDASFIARGRDPA